MARDDRGHHRLDSEHDFVRVEIAAALKRSIPVIPILLEGTRMPNADELPDDLKALARRNALDVRHASFHSDMDKLIRGLKVLSDQAAGLPASRPDLTAGSKAAAAAPSASLAHEPSGLPQLLGKVLQSLAPSPESTAPTGPSDPEVAGIFRNMREAKGLSREAIARWLETTTSTIEALELGDVHSLPDWTETVRIVRRFCELLRLDPEPLLGRLQQHLRSQG